ncbi:MAG TPA: PstS family phosphate ABC transporter substrate-binding protein [Candidatus Limnocylindrales bacterium]|nr:PstS family phosphate ABC transporter substrate-binding protein [Candidatus Limnocylindrales bacterium]
MTITTPKRLGALALAAAFAVGACSSGGGTSAAPSTASSEPSTNTAPESSAPAALSGTVTIDGSSTVYPITEAVAEEFQNANNGVQVPTAFSGTGGGFKKFCTGETDINDASRPIKADDEGEGKACTANGIEYAELQIAIDGLTVVVNPANSFVSCLTVDELKKIYGPDSPKNLNWSDVRADFPAQPINRFMPGADSGTFDYFTEEINGETDAATQNATQSEDDNVLVTGVSGDQNGIAFFGYAYYVENKDKLKAIGVDGGSGCVDPTDATINDGSYSPLSRPLFIYPDIKKAQERPELKAFVDFYLANTSALSAEVGYIAMPEDKLAAEVAEWEAAIGG